MSADLPDGAVTAAQEYDLAHRDDADQPRWQTWSRVDDHQVTRLLAGALPALTAAIAERAAAAERARIAVVIREMWGKPTGEMIANALERGQL